MNAWTIRCACRCRSDIILGVANSYDDVTMSDLQGIADVAAKKIIELVRPSER